MTLGKLAADLALAATQGSDLLLSVTVLENSNPYLFDGTTLETRIFNQDGTLNDTNFTNSTDDNRITLILSDTATTALGADSFTWELRATKDNITSPWLAGVLTIVAPGFGGSSSVATTLEVNNAPAVQLSLAVGYNYIPNASLVPFTPSDPLTETNVQDALDELATAVAPRIPTVKSSVFIEDNTTATQVTQNVAAKVAGTFLAGPACMNCVYDSNRITYVGTRNTRVLAVASVDIDGPNNVTFLIELRRNGQSVDGLRSKVRKGVGVASGSIVGHIPLTPNDYVELWITDLTAAQNPVVSDATFALMN